MSTPYFRFEHGAHFVLKGRILPEHREHGGGKCVLKMSTGWHASILAIFLCECIDKMNKKVHNKFTSKYRHIQEHGFAGYFARSTEKRGVNPRRRNGTVRCECFFRLAQQRGHSRERGRLCGKNGRKPAHQVRIFGSNLHSWLSQRSSMQCIKTFAPRFEKTLVLFYCRNRRARYRAILYSVKNEEGCLARLRRGALRAEAHNFGNHGRKTDCNKKFPKGEVQNEKNIVAAFGSDDGRKPLPHNGTGGRS